MTKAQLDAIINHIKSQNGPNYRMRINLRGGSWWQGTCTMLGTHTLIITQENKQVAYVDLKTVMSITAG